MLNFINLMSGNIPPHKPPRGSVKQVRMEGAGRVQSPSEMRRSVAMLRSGNEERVRRKNKRKEALLADLKKRGPGTAKQIAKRMEYSETNTRILIEELVSEKKATASKTLVNRIFSAA